MRSTVISFFLLLIPMSTESRRLTTQCVGESTKLSCLDSSNLIEDNGKIHVFWKKATGERVIWKYSDEIKLGESFKNRAELNHDLSLSINGCDPSDQGIYILCINGKPSCQIKLFVNASKQCSEPKPYTEQPTTVMATEVTSDTNEKHLETEIPPPNTYIRWIIYVNTFVFVLVVSLLVVFAYIQRKETSKDEKTESKLLQVQSNCA